MLWSLEWDGLKRNFFEKNNMNNCDVCHWETDNSLHWYTICEDCEKSLKLFSKKTIGQNILKFGREEYKSAVEERIEALDLKYLKARIKLLDIQSKLK